METTDIKLKWIKIKSKIAVVKHVWRIENVRAAIDEQSFESKKSLFSAAYCDWEMRFERRDDCFALLLDCLTSAPPRLLFTAQLLQNNNQKYFCFSSTRVFKDIRNGMEDCLVSFENLLDAKNDLLKDGALTVVCKLEILIEEAGLYVGDQTRLPLPVTKEPRPSGDMSYMMGLFCDATLEVGTKRFEVHRAILAGASSAFRAMFENDMTENRERIVRITDLDAEVIEDVVEYIYRGKPPNIEQLAGELLAAADKYDLEGLKTMCEAELTDQLSLDNAAELLVLADVNHGEQLKKAALYWIARRLSSVMSTDGWKALSQHHHHLVDDVLSEMATLFNQLSKAEEPVRKLALSF